MSNVLLVPAYPAVLRQWLPLPVVYFDASPRVAVHYKDSYDPPQRGCGIPGVTIVMPCHVAQTRASASPHTCYASNLRLNLHNLIAYTACVRTLLATLRPDAPVEREPPVFGKFMGCHGWSLSIPGTDEEIVFWTDNMPPHAWRVPDLAHIDDNDDLSALAAVMHVVMGKQA